MSPVWQPSGVAPKTRGLGRTLAVMGTMTDRSWRVRGWTRRPRAAIDVLEPRLVLLRLGCALPSAAKRAWRLPECTHFSRRRGRFSLEGEGMGEDMAYRRMSRPQVYHTRACTRVHLVCLYPLNRGPHGAPSACTRVHIVCLYSLNRGAHGAPSARNLRPQRTCRAMVIQGANTALNY